MNKKETILFALESDFSEPVRDPVWKNIYLSEGFTKLIDSEAFVKLSRIKQLGPTSLVYPGATHTRYAHSIGVFHVAKGMIRSLTKNSSLPDFVTLEGIYSFLAASLLHDLGHFPFAHSLKELPIRDHEELTGDYILEPDLARSILEAGADPLLCASIVDKNRDANGNKELIFFRSLLSGVLDPDKLDYLNRDAFFSGVPYGIQDLDYIFTRIHAHGEKGVCIDSKGIQAVEAILFSKYLMYKAVYWHKNVRCATAMIKKAVIAALTQGSLQSETLYGLDDDSFYQLLMKLPALESSLAERVFKKQLFSLVLEVPFTNKNLLHTELLDLTKREAFEKELAYELCPKNVSKNDFSVILDIPEPISFESDLFISDENVSFTQSSSVFSKGVVQGFTENLRVIRLFVSHRLEATSVCTNNRLSAILDFTSGNKASI